LSVRLPPSRPDDELSYEIQQMTELRNGRVIRQANEASGIDLPG
jgi:hypothetical protein